MNTWSPVDGTIWEGLGFMTTLELVCHWGQAFEVLKYYTISRSCPLVLLDQMWAPSCYASTILHPCCLAPHHDGLGLTLWNCEPQINSVLFKLSWSWHLITAIKKVTEIFFNKWGAVWAKMSWTYIFHQIYKYQFRMNQSWQFCEGKNTWRWRPREGFLGKDYRRSGNKARMCMELKQVYTAKEMVNQQKRQLSGWKKMLSLH